MNSFKYFEDKEEDTLDEARTEMMRKNAGSHKVKASARRKKTFYKAKQRYDKMLAMCFYPATEHDNSVVFGFAKNGPLLTKYAYDSPTGKPTALAVGGRQWEVCEDLPKTTKLYIDGHALYKKSARKPMVFRPLD